MEWKCSCKTINDDTLDKPPKMELTLVLLYGIFVP